MESNGSRTPILGLRYTTDALLNANWETLDHTIANAFQPESPIQFPENFYVPENSVVKQAIYPGESIYAHGTDFFAEEGICLLANPFRAFNMTPMNALGGRGGWYFSFGCCALSIENLTASPQACDLMVVIYAYGTNVVLLNRCPMVLPPTCKLPFTVPLSSFGGAPFPPPSGNWDAYIEVMKSSGADANVRMRVEGGTFHMVEMP